MRRRQREPGRTRPWWLVAGALACLASVVAWSCTRADPAATPSAPSAAGAPAPSILAQPILPPLTAAAPAAVAIALPPGSDPLAGAEPAFNAWNNAGSCVTEAIDGQRFASAFRVRTTSKPSMTHAIRHLWTSTAPIAAGQALLLDVSLQGIQLQSAAYVVQVGVVLRGEGEQILKTTLNADAAWKRFRIAAKATRAQPAGKMVLELHYGVDPQELRIGGVALTAYPAGTPVAALPSEGFDYAGRAPDAPWRQEAERRIERLRTQLLTVRGQPGATVRVQQQRHAFFLGTALSSRMFEDQGPDGRRYREEITRIFTQVTFEGEHKWPAWEQPKRRAVHDRMVAWCREQGLDIYGHTLVWGGWKFLPERLKQLENDPEALRSEVRKHVSEQATALRGRVTAWDVVNEPFTQGDLLRILGRAEAAEWFRLAKAADPAARLILNDYEILDTRAASPAHRDFLEGLTKELLAAKAPLEGLGFQGHMYPGFTPPEELWRILDRFAAHGLPIAVTEHDINVGDETLQGDYARDFLLAMMAHPAITGITLWGFWDGSHWKDNGLLYRGDWSLKPSGQAWLGLLKGQWWTDREVTIGPDGTAVLRVWKGGYQVGSRSVTVGDAPVEISP